MRIEALAAFLTKNPEIASICTIKPMEWGGIVSLYFEEKAYIHPTGNDPVKLRLERDMQTGTVEQEKVVCDDVSVLSRRKLKSVLKKVKIDLDNPDSD